MHVRSEQKQLKQIATLEHQGCAIVFAAASVGGYDEVFYAVLDDASQKDGAGNVASADVYIDQNWSSFQKLPSATQTRVAGMGLVTSDVPGIDADGKPNTTSSLTRTSPFCVVSDDGHVCLFRASTLCAGGILVDRFVLQAEVGLLVHATEVRYVRSENPYVPQSDTDTLGDASMEGDPFVEPAFLLPLEKAIDADGFTVVRTPGKPNAVWHILLSGTLSLFSIPSSGSTPFDVSQIGTFGTGTGSGGEQFYPLIRPAAIYYIYYGNSVVDVASPAAALYYQQEPGAFGTSDIHALGEASVLVTANTPHGLLALDLAVGHTGRLAGSPMQEWTLQSVEHAVNLHVANQTGYGAAIELDGRNDALVLPDLPAGATTFLGWFRPHQGDGQERCLAQFGYRTDRAIAVVLDEAHRIAIREIGGSDASPVASSETNALLPLPPGIWCCVGFTFDGSVFALYLNGTEVAHFAPEGGSAGAASCPLTIGQGRDFGGFRGAVASMYIWGSVLPADIVLSYSGLQKAGGSPIHAFAVNEGRGSSLLDQRTGQTCTDIVRGGRWVRGCAPTYAGMMPLSQPDYLALTATMLIDVSAQGAACPVACADGLVRVAYRTQQDHWGVVHYDTRAQRAQSTFAWQGEHEASPSPKLLFIAITAGLPQNGSTIRMTRATGADTLSMTISGTTGGYRSVSEQWHNLPVALGPLVEVINGKSPTYDYASTANVQRTIDGKAIPESQLPPRTFRHASLVFSAQGIASGDVLRLQEVPPTQGNTGMIASSGVGAGPGWVCEPVPASSARPNFAIPDGGKFAGLGDLTLEALACAPGTGVASILSHGATGAVVPFLLGIDNGRPFAVRGNGRSQVAALAAASIPANMWTHLAASYRDSSALHLHSQAYVDCGPLRRAPKGAVTLEAWVMPDSSISGTRQLVSRWSADPGDKQFKLLLAKSASGADGGFPAFKVQDGTGNSHSVQASTAIGIGTWTHLAGVYRAAGTQNMLSFDGSGYVRVLDGDGVTDALTLEMWVRPLSWTGSNDAVLMSCGMTNNDHSLFKLALRKSGNDIQVIVGGQNNQKVDSCTIGVIIPHAKDMDDDRADTHLAAAIVTTGPGQASITVYVNGQEMTSRNFSFTFSEKDPALGWMLGAEWGGGDSLSADLANGQAGVHNHYSGGMRDVRLWSVARTTRQIIDHMNVPVDADATGLRGWWKLDSPPSDSILSGSDAKFTVQARVNDAVSGGSSPVHGKASYYACPFTSRMDLYTYTSADGQLHHDQNAAIGDATALGDSQAPLLMGREDTVGSVPWAGAIDEVRLWSVPRMAAQIVQHLKTPIEDPTSQAALLAYWNFDDGSGQKVVDRTGGDAGTIKGIRNVDDAEPPFWIDNPLTSTWKLYADGVELPLDDASRSGTIGDGFRIGQGWSGSTQFDGYLNELRIWNRVRRGAEIRSAMRRPLIGDEEGLVAYWPCTDNPRTSADGSVAGGTVSVADRTADPADAVYPEGVHGSAQVLPGTGGPAHPAPVSDDADYAINASNGLASPAAKAMKLAGAPGMCELMEGSGSVRVALNKPKSSGSELSFDTDMDAGATELAYLGQVQTGARIIGFIEGAPPVPSENLGVEASSNPDKYADCARIALSHGDTTKSGGVNKLDIGAKLAVDANRGTKADISESYTYPITIQFVEAQMVTRRALEFELGAKVRFTTTARMHGTSDLDTGLSVAGGFEQNLYNLGGFPEEEMGVQPRRLYRPDNVGTAIVRSLTADFYAVRSRRSGATAGYRTVVDPNVPPDTNIITFKMNPAYTKNGTLDGHVGFDLDVNYSGLQPGEKGSYYKAQEAYAEKGRIERDRAEYGNYFTNIFKATAANAQSREAWIARTASGSLVNTYVWTASGGLSSEQNSRGASRRFSFGLDFDGSLKIGASREFESELGAGLVMGPVAGLGASIAGSVDGVYTRANGDEVEFGLEAEVNVEGFLCKQAIPVENLDVSSCDWGPRTLPSRDCPQGQPANYLAPTDPLTALLISRHLVTRIGTGTPGVFTTRYRIYAPTRDSWILEDVRGKYAVSLMISALAMEDGPDGATFEEFTYATFTPMTDAGAAQYPINYQEEACPGKVLGYRFMSFYIEPDTSNFKKLAAMGDPSRQIIDADWLNDADNPDAVALKDALTRPNPAWRIYHRTTYVNRVPPEPEKENEAPTVEHVTAPGQAKRPDAVSLARNDLLIRLLMGDLDADMATSHPQVGKVRASPRDEPDMAVMDANIILFVNTLGLDKAPARQLANQLHDYMVAYLAPDTMKVANRA